MVQLVQSHLARYECGPAAQKRQLHQRLWEKLVEHLCAESWFLEFYRGSQHMGTRQAWCLLCGSNLDHFSVAVIQCPDKSHLREQGFILPQSGIVYQCGWKVTAARAWSRRTQHIHQPGAESKECSYSACLLYFMRYRIPTQGMVLPTTEMGFPIRINLTR